MNRSRKENKIISVYYKPFTMPVFLAVTAAHKGILVVKFAFLQPVHRLHCRRAPYTY